LDEERLSDGERYSKAHGAARAQEKKRKPNAARAFEKNEARAARER
jgi:hypothetical protein